MADGTNLDVQDKSLNQRLTRNASRSTSSLDIIRDDSDSLSGKSVGRKPKKPGKNRADGQNRAVTSNERVHGLDANRKKDMADSEDYPCSKCDGIIHDHIKALQCEFCGDWVCLHCTGVPETV